MKPTAGQVEACRVALGFAHNARGARVWQGFTDEERQGITEDWLMMQLPRSPATQRMVDELYGTAFRKEE